MYIIGFILLFFLSLGLELGVAVRVLDEFGCELIEKGYKVNFDLVKVMIAKKPPKTIGYILLLFPGINIIQVYAYLKLRINAIKTDPLFIRNMEPLSLRDKLMIQDLENEEKDFLFRAKRFYNYVSMSEDAQVKDDEIDIGNYTKKEMKNNDILITKEVIEKMINLDNVQDTDEKAGYESSFYTLPGNYSLSDVLKLDENPIFIKTGTNTDVAIINATKEEVEDFASKSYIVKPTLQSRYHIVSIKPFDKDVVRKALFEIEFQNMLSKSVIEAPYFEVKDVEEKKRTL